MSEALANVIKEYPGWTMFCIVMLILAVCYRIENWRR